MKLFKKILHVNYSDNLGGAAISCQRLHYAQLKNNIDSWLFSYDQKNNSNRSITFDSGYKKNEYLLKKVISKLISRPFENEKIIKSLSIFETGSLKKINSFDCDVVNLHWICNEMLLIENIKKINKPLVWTILDMWPFIGADHICLDSNLPDAYWKNNNEKKKNTSFLNKWVLKRKIKNFPKDIKLVCISNWLKKKALESSVFKDYDIDYIPCTLNFNKWKILDKKNSRKILNLPKDKKIILFVTASGTDDYRKGFHILKKALKNIVKTDDLHLVIVGRAMKKDLKDLKIENTIYDKFYSGKSDFLNLIYSSADLLTVPSLIEPFGQVAVEALACGLPTLAFKNTGLEDIIDHKKTGYLSNFLDQENFLDGLKWLLYDFDHDVSKKSIRDHGINNFSEKKISNEYLKVYNKF
jgi:glycosyltransferase involved in cell wall biosynthesis